MARSKKGGLHARRKTALALLEARYEEFKAAHEDKKPWTTHGGTKAHPGCSYEAECTRLSNEIKILKDKISKVVA